jgi:hypothetical protein
MKAPAVIPPAINRVTALSWQKADSLRIAPLHTLINKDDNVGGESV